MRGGYGYQIVRYPVRNPGDSYSIDPGNFSPAPAPIIFEPQAPSSYDISAPWGGGEGTNGSVPWGGGPEPDVVGFPFSDDELMQGGVQQNPFFAPPAINYESWWPRMGCQVNPPEEEDFEEIAPRCPVCPGQAALLGQLGALTWYQCQDCGIDFSIRARNPVRLTTRIRRPPPAPLPVYPSEFDFNPRRRMRGNQALRDFTSWKIPELIREGYPPKQAVAIAYSEARRRGYSVPPSRNPHYECASCGAPTDGRSRICSSCHMHLTAMDNPSRYGADRPFHALTSPFSGMGCPIPAPAANPRRTKLPLARRHGGRRLGKRKASPSKLMQTLRAAGLSTKQIRRELKLIAQGRNPGKRGRRRK